MFLGHVGASFCFCGLPLRCKSRVHWVSTHAMVVECCYSCVQNINNAAIVFAVRTLW